MNAITVELADALERALVELAAEVDVIVARRGGST